MPCQSLTVTDKPPRSSRTASLSGLETGAIIFLRSYRVILWHALPRPLYDRRGGSPVVVTLLTKDLKVLIVHADTQSPHIASHILLHIYFVDSECDALRYHLFCLVWVL
jgi:hypothetical protein